MEIIASKKSIDLLIFSEISSETYYNKFLIHPVVPAGDSGITIGAGYDCGQMTKDLIISDWHEYLSIENLKLLITTAGLKGEKAKAILPSVKKISVSFEDGCKVFYKRSLPKYAKMTFNLYPGLDKLAPDAIGALISMIYNRGAATTGTNREEIKSIIHLVPPKDYAGIAALVLHSKRIWENKKGMEGILTRRTTEANLIANAVHQYNQEDLITINI